YPVTLAIVRVEVGVGGVVVRKSGSAVVPLESFAGEVDRDGAQQRDLREAAAIFEVRAGLAARLDRVEPVPVMALDPRDLLRGRVCAGVLVPDALRKEVAAARAMGAVDDHPLIADQDGARARNLIVGGEAVGFGDGRAAVMPDQLD